MAAMIVLHLTCSRSNHITQLSGNTEEHSRRVQLRLLKNIILHTPELRKIFNPVEKNLKQSEIRHPKNGSFAQMNTQSTSMAFGQGFSVLWHSDLHALIDDSAFNAMQSGLLDTSDALLLVDSNVDHLGGRVHKIELHADEDESIFCNRIKYESWEEFLRLAPRWISRKRAERIKKTVLEAEWKRDLLGLRSSVVNSLFPQDVIDLCRDSYRCPVEDIKSLVGERSFVIGGGLDRADSEWGSVFGNDNSVFTVTCKVADPKNQEPQIYVLDQRVFRPSTGRAIKKHILRMHKRYCFKNVTLEAHNVTDIQPYLIEQGVPCETINPHSTTQNIAWPELVRIAKTSRLRISEDLSKLFHEMAGMTYTKTGTGNYKFGADTKAAKDDRCFSLLWAVYIRAIEGTVIPQEPDRCWRIAERKSKNVYTLKHRDIVVGLVRPERRNIGILLSKRKDIVGSPDGIAVVRVKGEKISDYPTEWLFATLRSEACRLQFWTESGGTSYGKLTHDQIRDVLLPMLFSESILTILLSVISLRSSIISSKIFLPLPIE
jgi:hypothetical protein